MLKYTQRISTLERKMFKLKVPQAEVAQIFFAIIFVTAICEMIYLTFVDLAMETTLLGVTGTVWLVTVPAMIIAATIVAGDLDLAEEFDQVVSGLALLTITGATILGTRFFWFELQDPNSVYMFIWPVLLVGAAILITTNTLELFRHDA